MTDEPANEVPSSRLRRTAAQGRLAATEAAKYAGTRAVNLTRSPGEANDALGRRQIDAAQQIVRVLGGMKGAAMKAGQVLSVADLEAVPPEYREEVRATLASLRDSAPAVGFNEMRRVIERELGEPLSRVFAEFHEVPVAAASSPIRLKSPKSMNAIRPSSSSIELPGCGSPEKARCRYIEPK